MSQIPLSRAEEILQSKIDGTSYDKPPQSRVEALLLELDVGGGGGGTNDYNQLLNKPSINGVTLTGNVTSDDIKVEQGNTMTYDPDSESIGFNFDALYGSH